MSNKNIANVGIKNIPNKTSGKVAESVNVIGEYWRCICCLMLEIIH